MSSTEEYFNQFKAIIKGKSLDITIDQDADPEKNLIRLFEKITDNVQALKQEKKALTQVISETTDQFQERILDLSIVRRFGEELDIFVSMEEFNNKLLEILLEELGAESCSIMIVDKSTDELVLQAGRNRSNKDFKLHSKERRIKIGEGIAGQVAKDGRAMLINNVDDEPCFIPMEDAQIEICSLLCIPFPSSGEVLGVINLSHPSKGIFSDNNKRILNMLANQIAMAITNNSILRAEQEVSKNNITWAISSLVETNRRLKMVSDVSRLISSSLDLAKTLNVILIKVNEVLQAERASILLIEEDTGDLVLEIAIGKGTDNLQNASLKTGVSISGYVAETGKPILVTDIEKDPRIMRTNRPSYSTKSLISVPLASKGRIIGVLNISDKINKSSFMENDLELVTALASQISIAIQNASMFERKKQTVLELEVLNDINDKIQRARNISIAMEMIMESVSRITNFSFSLFYYWNPKKHKLSLKHFRGISDSEAEDFKLKFSDKVTSLIQEDPLELTKSPEKYFDNIIQMPKIKDALHKRLVPFVVEEKFFGLLVICKNVGRDFTRRDLNFLQIIASQAAALYERSLTLISASQLITLGEIMVSAMHDLKNPLTAIKGTIQLLVAKGDDPALIHKGLEVMSNSVSHLEELIDGYFSITGSHMTHFQAQNINTVLRKLLATVKTRFARYHIQVNLDLAEDIPTSIIDYRQVYEALLNIMINALQAMEGRGSGEVNISTRLLEVEDDKELIEIRIKDDGPGISKKHQEKIFERFFTTKENGTGLGLPLVQQIIKNHMGTIEVASEENEGTEFIIKLPVSRERPKTEFM